MSTFEILQRPSENHATVWHQALTLVKQTTMAQTGTNNDTKKKKNTHIQVQEEQTGLNGCWSSFSLTIPSLENWLTIPQVFQEAPKHCTH